MATTQRRLVVVLGVMVGLLAAASIAYACGVISTLKLDQEQAAPGDTVTGQGDVFREGEGFNDAEVRWGSREGQVLWSGSPGEDRTIHPEFTVPDVEPGSYMVLATQTDAEGNPVAGSPARTTIEVTADGAGTASVEQASAGGAAAAGPQGEQEAGAAEAGAAEQQSVAASEAGTTEQQAAAGGERQTVGANAAAPGAGAAEQQAAAGSAASPEVGATQQQAAAQSQQAAAAEQSEQAATAGQQSVAATAVSPDPSSQVAASQQPAAVQAADATRFATAERQLATAPVSHAAGAAEFTAAEHATGTGSQLSPVAAWTAATVAGLASAAAAIDGSAVAWMLAGLAALAMVATMGRRQSRRTLALAAARLR